jgi:hypothetical protein
MELSAEHEMGKLLRDYADENFCLIFGLDTPTRNPYNPSATSDVLNIVITKDLSFPMYRLCALHKAQTTSQYSLTLRVAHSFDTQLIALIYGALIGPTSKLT